MDITEYTTEELLALASGLALPDPTYFRRPPITEWPAELRNEVDQIGLRSLAARGLIRQPSDSSLEVPEILASLMTTICTSELMVQFARVGSGSATSAAFVIGPELSAGQRLTALGNHRFSLIPTEHVGAALLELFDVVDRPESEAASVRVSLDQFRSMIDAASTTNGDDDFDAQLRSAGVKGEAARVLKALAVDGSIGNVVQVLRPGETDLSVEGSLTSWIDVGNSGLWIAEQVGDAAQEPLVIQLSPTTREALLESIAGGFPDWYEANGFTATI
jgi:hypothetical protein